MASQKNSEHKMTAQKLREFNVTELSQKLFEKSDELMRARFKHATATLENTSELKKLRRQIARISTVLNEKQGKAKNAGSGQA